MSRGRFALVLALPLLASVAPRPGAEEAVACLRPVRPGTQVQGEVRVCPGRYRIADPQERGVIVAAASGTRIDLSGVVLESGDSMPADFVGIGVAVRGVDNVAIVNGTIRGYRYGVRIDGGRHHRVSGVDVSGSRAQALRSTSETYDARDWLDLFRPDTFEQYGAGVYLKWTDGAMVTGVVARNGQNGIGLFGARGSYLAENDVSHNTGWGIHLWRTARSTIVRNRARYVVRCESRRYSHGCASAGIALREQSDSNLIVDNDLRYSGTGILIGGERKLVRPSTGNLVLRNDVSAAYHAGVAVVGGWSNTFEENRADSADVGIALAHAHGSTLRGNTAIGTRTAGITIAHGTGDVIASNVVIGGPVGIRLTAPDSTEPPGRGYRVDDNVLAKLGQGIVLQRTVQTRIRGNLFDGVGDGLVVDQVGHGTEVTGNIFLRASGWFIQAPELAAGNNYWATATAEAAAAKVRGKVSVAPWRPASAAGY